jgi:hypothetical protein
LRAAPRTDPYVRNYLIRLLPRVHVTASRSLGDGCSINRVRLSLLAACRTRHNPCDSHPRLWVRNECACGAFPLVALLPSADSAANAYAPALFARFVGTMRPSDSPQTCMSKLRPLAFFDRPTLPSSVGVCRASRFSRIEFPHMPRVSDSAVSKDSSRNYRCPSCCLPHIKTRSAHRSGDFGAQYLACAYPCQRFTRVLTNADA